MLDPLNFPFDFVAFYFSPGVFDVLDSFGKWRKPAVCWSNTTKVLVVYKMEIHVVRLGIDFTTKMAANLLHSYKKMESLKPCLCSLAPQMHT